ncbi:hypothetical protein MLD38_004573 [Melastoma candidum]|uniref:Uncharacterized protein n=1 Tax=Melastoma candidum TaxID=119954 RepID=A0ACB9SAS5_9MYRT|nr:hypothetical protein MLD38_004573 [Melastoma candidum]
METSRWNLPPLMRDSFSMIGSGLGGTASAFYGFNHVMPVVHKWVKGPMSLHFLIGAPLVIVFSSTFTGLTVPDLQCALHETLLALNIGCNSEPAWFGQSCAWWTTADGPAIFLLSSVCLLMEEDDHTAIERSAG